MTVPLAVDLLVRDARRRDDGRRPPRTIPGGWVGITDGVVTAVGVAGNEPAALETVRADDCLVTPGLINTHHHIYQNLTRAYAPALRGGLFHWLQTLYPVWSRLDEEAAYLSAWVGCAGSLSAGARRRWTISTSTRTAPATSSAPRSAPLARSGSDSTPRRGFDESLRERRWTSARLRRAGRRRDPRRAASDSSRAHHDPGPDGDGAGRSRPCSPFSVTTELMQRTAELAERLDVRMHTHIAGGPKTKTSSASSSSVAARSSISIASDRPRRGRGSRIACIRTRARSNNLARWGVGVAHCPELEHAYRRRPRARSGRCAAPGVTVGIGCDGSGLDRLRVVVDGTRAPRCCSAGCGSARRRWPHDDALEMATLGGATCLGREGRYRHARARGGGRRRRLAAHRDLVRGARPTRSKRGCAAGRSAPGPRSSRARSSCARAASCTPTSKTWSPHAAAADRMQGNV